MVAKLLELFDPVVEICAPAGGKAVPVGRGGGSSFREAFQRRADGGEGDAESLRNLYYGYAA